MYFAGTSTTWHGGVAFYDHDVPGPTPARAYLVTAEQFADVAAPEMHRVPDPDDPLEEVIMGGLDVGRHEAVPATTRRSSRWGLGYKSFDRGLEL